MEKKIKCNFGDVIFYINTFNEKDYNDQLEHIREFYLTDKVHDLNNPNIININYITESNNFNKYLAACKKRKGKYYQTFENQIHKEIKADNGKSIFIIDNEEYICIKDNENNITILTDGNEKGIKWPFRILRELLVRQKENEKKLFMHGTGLEIEGKGIALFGNSGSGKTTLALDFLANDTEQKGFISNDRIFIDDNTMQYFPIPVVIASGTAKNNKKLDQYLKEKRLFEKRVKKCYEETLPGDKVDVPLTDIKEIYEGTTLYAEQKMDIIVFPRINKELENKYVIKELNNRQKYINLDCTCFTPFDIESLRLEWIKKRKLSQYEIAENKFDTINNLIKNKRILEVEYGLKADREKIREDLTR